MRRILLLVTVAAVMVTALALGTSSAFAAIRCTDNPDGTETCTGGEGGGGDVGARCANWGIYEGCKTTHGGGGFGGKTTVEYVPNPEDPENPDVVVIDRSGGGGAGGGTGAVVPPGTIDKSTRDNINESLEPVSSSPKPNFVEFFVAGGGGGGGGGHCTTDGCVGGSGGKGSR